MATDTMDGHDKHWAQRYILGPLTAPEPSQETGPGASHYNRLRGPVARPISIIRPTPHPGNLPSSPPRHPKSPSPRRKPTLLRRRTNDSSDNEDGLIDPFADSSASNFFNNPTPPDSADKHSRLPHHYHPSNPYSPVHNRRVSSPLDTHAEEGTASSSRPPRPPISLAQHHRYRQPIPSGPSSGVNRTASDRVPGSHRPDYAAADHNRSRSAGYNNPSRCPTGSSTLAERYPGDMSHRPLDVIKRESRTADRRHRKRYSETDTIDLLDTIGPAYHHGGPFDATLASRNQNQKYSPVAAVRESNMAALRATPRENIADSLKRHYPLQGTSSIPPGGFDMSGNVMSYEEGADLMREPDAEGGAYKRWDGVQYHPDDLKGKGEPSFTYDRDRKEKTRESNDIEMDQRSPLMARRAVGRARSSTHGGETSAPGPQLVSTAEGSSSGTNVGKHPEQTQQLEVGVERRSSTNRISDGLKRRFGSLRKKKGSSPEAE